jgi:hypothetical protein
VIEGRKAFTLTISPAVAGFIPPYPSLRERWPYFRADFLCPLRPCRGLLVGAVIRDPDLAPLGFGIDAKEQGSVIIEREYWAQLAFEGDRLVYCCFSRQWRSAKGEKGQGHGQYSSAVITVMAEGLASVIKHSFSPFMV